MPLTDRGRTERPESLRDHADSHLRDAIVSSSAPRAAPTGAARATHDNWSTLGRLLHLDDDDAHSPTTAEGAPWPSPTSPATG